jgi:hypothetical protein
MLKTWPSDLRLLTSTSRQSGTMEPLICTTSWCTHLDFTTHSTHILPVFREVRVFTPFPAFEIASIAPNEAALLAAAPRPGPGRPPRGPGPRAASIPA